MDLLLLASITGRLNVSSGLDSRLWFDLYLGRDIKIIVNAAVAIYRGKKIT